MDNYEKNRQSLKIGQPLLYSKLEHLDTCQSDNTPEQIEELETREGLTALVITRGGVQYRLNSSLKPVTESERWASQYELEAGEGVVAMFGLGNGLFVRSLLNRVSVNTAVLIYEPSAELFFYCLRSYELSDILSDSRVKLTIEDADKLDFREYLLQYMNYFNLESALTLLHPQYARAYPEAEADFKRLINANRERLIVNRNTLVRFKDSSVRNTLLNLRYIKEANLAEELGQIVPRELPVIIVSAGPSLDKNAELLREAKGHAFIIAVDTAIKYLMKRDIMPDITITVEPEKPVEHYEDIRSCELPLICDIESNPLITDKHTGRKFIFNCRGFLKQLYESEGMTVENGQGSGGSVATAAFALCYQLKFKSIILIGQDLAYSGEATHAGGVESMGINHSIGYEMIEGIDGEAVRTRSDWLGYLRWFENAIMVIRDMKLDVTVYDCTEGGARIHGTELLTLREAIDRLCTETYDFQAALAGLKPFIDETGYADIAAKLRESKAELDSMADRAAEAAKICSDIIEKLSKTSDNRSKAGIEEVCQGRERNAVSDTQRYCERNLLYPLVNDHAIASVADDIQRLCSECRDEAAVETGRYRRMKLAFEAIPAACSDISKYELRL